MAIRCAGLADQWREGLDPWVLTDEDGKWYGRGSADNKGQHALNLSALEAVLKERGGNLGFSVKLILETSEERGSNGLRQFVAATVRPAAGRCADRLGRAARRLHGPDGVHRDKGHVPLRPWCCGCGRAGCIAATGAG